jgi:putative transposase
MPRRLIPLLPGYFYHIYNRAVAENLLFQCDENYSFFKYKINKYLSPIAVVAAYCLMPNHYHLLIHLKTEDLPQAMLQLAMSYTKSFNKVYRRSGHLFQGRYQCKLVNDQKYLDHLTRYIHANPVSAGLVQRPEDWDHSSYREYIGLEPADFINPNLVYDLWDPTAQMPISQKQSLYKDYVEEMILINNIFREF